MSDSGILAWLDTEAKRLEAWNLAHPVTRIGATPPYRFSLAEMRRWAVDRSSGYLRLVVKPKRARRAISVPALDEVRATLRAIRADLDQGPLDDGTPAWWAYGKVTALLTKLAA